MAIVMISTGSSIDASIQSSIQHGVQAGLACLRSADMSTQDVNVLIHTGVFRDKNMVEPAMAAMIQKRIEQYSSKEIRFNLTRPLPHRTPTLTPTPTPTQVRRSAST